MAVFNTMTDVRALADLAEDELVVRAKTDGDAFGVLYDRHVRRIFNYVYFRVGRRHQEAEDLAERVFIRALEGLSGYEPRGAPFSAWLFRIAHNLVANWHRDTGRHPTTSVDEVDQWEDRQADPPGDALDAEERAEVRDAVGHLPVDRQQLLHMKFTEELSTAEIAKAMGRTEGAVKALLHRTLVGLRKELTSRELSR